MNCLSMKLSKFPPLPEFKSIAHVCSRVPLSSYQRDYLAPPPPPISLSFLLSLPPICHRSPYFLLTLLTSSLRTWTLHQRVVSHFVCGGPLICGFPVHFSETIKMGTKVTARLPKSGVTKGRARHSVPRSDFSVSLMF